MHDILGNQSTNYDLAEYRLTRMVLAPIHWSKCKLPVQLKWRGVKFSRKGLKKVPDRDRGVYTFVVKPGIAQHPSCSYLLYVGQTSEQSFRRRFSQYISEKNKRGSSRRVHVNEMLNKWGDYLWFYYAKVSRPGVIEKIEGQLLAAYLPPSNRRFPATVSQHVKTLFAH